MTGKIMPLRERDTSTVQAAADAFLSSPQGTNGVRGGRGLAGRWERGRTGLLEQLWGQRAPATWNRNRGAVAAWLSWCAASRLPAPILPASAERRREHLNATRGTPPDDRPGADSP